MQAIPFARDLQDTAPLFHCRICQGEIYPGQPYYQTDDGPVCEDCLYDYAAQVFGPLRTEAASRFEEEAP